MFSTCSNENHKRGRYEDECGRTTLYGCRSSADRQLYMEFKFLVKYNNLPTSKREYTIFCSYSTQLSIAYFNSYMRTHYWLKTTSGLTFSSIRNSFETLDRFAAIQVLSRFVVLQNERKISISPSVCLPLMVFDNNDHSQFVC